MSDAYNLAHDQWRYAYEGRTNFGLERAENGGIRMDESHHSKGWEMGFKDGWAAAKADLPDEETVAALLLKFLNPPRYDGGSWTYAPTPAARAVLALIRGEQTP